MQIAKIPIKLPDGWLAEVDSRGVIVSAVDCEGRVLGYVTVCEKVRHFAMGISTVNRIASMKYTGRGWKENLYTDAVSSLQSVWQPTSLK